MDHVILEQLCVLPSCGQLSASLFNAAFVAILEFNLVDNICFYVYSQFSVGLKMWATVMSCDSRNLAINFICTLTCRNISFLFDFVHILSTSLIPFCDSYHEVSRASDF